MLIVKVELWPYGIEEAKELLADATIGNRGKDSVGNTYRAVLRERGDPELGIEPGEQIVEISGYNRRQSVWNLLLRVLANTTAAQEPIETCTSTKRQHAEGALAQRLASIKGPEPVPDDCDSKMHTVKAWAENGAPVAPPFTVADDEVDWSGSFLDLLPSAWGLTDRELEQLLDAPNGWLCAWRNHHVQLDAYVRGALAKLAKLQELIRLRVQPGHYSSFWHQAWAERSPIGNRTPWQAFEQDGREVIIRITQFLASDAQ